MRYVMFTWVHPDDASAWEAWKDADKEADVSRHREWFGKHRDKIAGGEELDYPRTVKMIRPGRQADGVVVTDGPYVEAKTRLSPWRPSGRRSARSRMRWSPSSRSSSAADRWAEASEFTQRTHMRPMRAQGRSEFTPGVNADARQPESGDS
jgi:hypothetical protein